MNEMYEITRSSKPEEQKAVPRAMDRLNEAVRSLEERLAELESCLNPVLGQSKPEPGQDGTVSVRCDAPLADTIFEVADQIHGATDFVKKILDRLEL